MEWMKAEGNSYEEAVNVLLVSLGADRSELEIEEMGEKKKLFGFGKKAYCVRGRLKEESFDAGDSDVSLESLSSEIAKIGGGDVSDSSKESGEFLKKILNGIGVSGAEVKVDERSDITVFDIESSAGGLVIGRKGETLEALQTILEIHATRKKGSRANVMVDTENYRKRQDEKIKQLVVSFSNEAIEKQKKVKLKPMPSSERKAVHALLQDNPKVETQSEGRGENRRVVIIPV